MAINNYKDYKLVRIFAGSYSHEISEGGEITIWTGLSESNLNVKVEKYISNENSTTISEIKDSTCEDVRAKLLSEKGVLVLVPKTHSYYRVVVTCEGCGESWTKEGTPIRNVNEFVGAIE